MVSQDRENDTSNERTSLLQNNNQTYEGRPPLDPDDPAVTPMSLVSVQIVRFLTLTFFVLTMAWWLTLMITTFVNPPGLQSRGGGWFDLAFTSLAGGILLLALLSFTVPSSAEQIVMAMTSLFLLIDMIIIVAVPQVRAEEGWTGVFSVVWVLCMSIWVVFTDRLVQWGKASEEERLIGRVEQRRSLRQWCSVFSTTFIMALFLGLSISFLFSLALRAHDATLKPPGRKYWVDDHRYQVHLYCTPSHVNDTLESVTVLVEGGEQVVARGLGDWMHDNYANGTVGRYCYWDRPGMGWSDVGPSPMSAGMAVDALSEALVDAGEDGPYILVSHGIGSIYSRIFASRHAGSVKGFLLIDPLHEDYLPHIARPARGFLIWARGIISPMGLDTTTGWIFRSRSREDRIYGRSSWQNPKQIKAKLQESLAANSFTRAEIRTARAITPGEIPLVIVSSGRRVKRDVEWDSRQKDLTGITDHLVGWDIVNKAEHNVWEDAEGYVVLSRRLKTLMHMALRR